MIPFEVEIKFKFTPAEFLKFALFKVIMKLFIAYLLTEYFAKHSDVTTIANESKLNAKLCWMSV